VKIEIDIRDIGFIEDRHMKLGQKHLILEVYLTFGFCNYSVISSLDSPSVIFLSLKVMHQSHNNELHSLYSSPNVIRMMQIKVHKMSKAYDIAQGRKVHINL
jgi:hypothetical protein